MANTPVQMRNERLGQYVVERLKKRNFDAYYCSDREQVTALVDSLIHDGSSVAWGGSSTIRDLGLTTHMHSRNLRVIDRDMARNPEETAQLHREGLLADCYLTSANALADDGVLVNVDGNGNRTAAMCFGPRSVIVVCGINKVCSGVEEAVSRARGVAATTNSMRFLGDTPCARTGKCFNCTSDQCICNQILITRMSKPAGRIKVILVGEELGF